MDRSHIIEWLMAGDAAIRYQVKRDLLHLPLYRLKSGQSKIGTEGWGARMLKKQKPNGHWGISFYQPKWTSTHYTLLDLKTLGLHPSNKKVQRSVEMMMLQPTGRNGGINCFKSVDNSDVCVNGMILNYSSYFLPLHPRLHEVVDFLLDTQMADGGWNCLYLERSTKHSSLHSTISVLEGLLQFRRSSPEYRLQEILEAEKEAVEFLLAHELFKSHTTGKTIDARMLRLSFPCRWRYDILRALDHFQNAEVPLDSRMVPALTMLQSKRLKDGRWPLQERHKGVVHFDMESVGKASRWNTLRALRVLEKYS